MVGNKVKHVLFVEQKGVEEEAEDDDDEEENIFQLFLVEERLTVAHRPNCGGSAAANGTLYPATVSFISISFPISLSITSSFLL